MLEYKVDFDKLEWKRPIEGVKSKVIQYGNKQMRLIEYSKKMPPHWCEKGHYGLILDGELEIEFPHQTIIYKSGDGVFIPDGGICQWK
jgi:ethanolamine utilization protein EutQ (cupin superfamily)